MERYNKNNQRPAGLQQLQAQQPPCLDVEVDAFQDKKTRKRKKDFAQDDRLGDSSSVWSMTTRWVGPASVIQPNLQLSLCCVYVLCMVITYSRVGINRVRLPILLMVS